MYYFKKLLSLFCLLFFIIACGGGSGGSSSSTRTDFPFRQALRDYNANSYEYNFTVTGSSDGVNLSGSGVITSSAAIAGSFEGQVGFASTSTMTATLTGNGVTIPIDSTGTEYFDSDYLGIGYVNSDTYNVNVSTQVPISISLNDSGSLGIESQYSDSTKTTLTGTTEGSYEAISQQGDTLMIEVTEIDYDPDHIETDRYVSLYSLTKTGVTRLVSIQGITSSGILTFEIQ